MCARKRNSFRSHFRREFDGTIMLYTGAVGLAVAPFISLLVGLNTGNVMTGGIMVPLVICLAFIIGFWIDFVSALLWAAEATLGRRM